MNDSTKIDIQDLSDKLIELARNSCWNDFSNSYAYIISEIVNDNKNFFEKRIERKKRNSKKGLLNIKQAREELDKIYENLYDVNWEFGGERYEWNMLLHKRRVKKELTNAKTK